MPDFFTPQVSQGYDARNSKLTPLSNGLHFLTQLVLEDLPADARVLCVGVGTGAEVLSLSKVFPGWTFLGVDPSESMLALGRENLAKAGVLERCELMQGYVQDVPAGEHFDAALSFLVAHFIGREDRLGFFQNMTNRLKPGGMLVNAEISHDLDAPDFPAMLQDWERVQRLMGATAESLAALPKLLRESLTVLSPRQTEDLLRRSGIAQPVRFFQAFMIQAWHGRKA